jgi:hypothetical protein
MRIHQAGKHVLAGGVDGLARWTGLLAGVQDAGDTAVANGAPLTTQSSSMDLSPSR